MYRYTTPYHYFKLPVEISRVSKLFITYAQYGEVLLEKDIDDCEVVDTHTVKVHLSQADTSLFESCDHEHKVELQLTLLTTGGERLTSNIAKLSAGRVLKVGEI